MSTSDAAGRQSALSGRISTVLSTSYSDLEIRDALTELDKRNFINTAESRRQLRLDIQDEVIKRNGDVLADFAGVVHELKQVEVILGRITSTCTTLRSHIHEANESTASMREEAVGLLAKKRDVETKQHLLGAFQKQFVISEDDLDLLTSSDPIEPDFFRALANLKRVHAESRLLLSASTDQLGLSILDQSSKTLNLAFQKLFRWTQREFRNLDLENPRLSASMRRALRVLAERPALFTNSLDNFASTRETILSNAFHVALTGQGDDTVGKPIEFQAHDPLRYISDMLAWVHSATVSEREALEVLFIDEGAELARGIQEGVDQDVWTRTNDDQVEVFNGRVALSELVARDVAGVARLLRQRADQVIQGQEDATVAFKMVNLLAFYRTTFKKLLLDDSDVLSILTHIQNSANRQFRHTMEDSIALMKSDLGVTPTDTNPPEFLKEALEILRNLLKSYDSSMAIGNEFGIEDLLQLCLNPFLEGSETLWKKLKSPDREILAINCHLEAVSSLSPYRPSTNAALTTLEAQIKTQAAALTSYMHSSLLSSSGLVQLISSISAILVTAVEELRSQDTLKPESLSEFSASLDAFLPEALVDASEEIRGLRSARLSREVLEEAADRFCDDFEKLEERILAVDEATEKNVDPEEEDQILLRDVFPRTSAEIRVLLS
jgi:hypothetical protein